MPSTSPRVIPSPAKVQGVPDSAGPTLRTAQGPAYAMGTSMRVGRGGVAGAGERVTIAPAARAVSVDRGDYSSGSDARLRRVRFALSGAGVKRITTCSAN